VRRAGVPDAGDIVWLEFSPQSGHEHSGRRLALVLSPAGYNGKTGRMVCCPMTTQRKGYPFEVVVTQDPPSVILADQVESLDWRARRAVRKGRAPAPVLDEVRAKIRALIGA
jgi:mRNA interferase MazF